MSGFGNLDYKPARHSGARTRKVRKQPGNGDSQKKGERCQTSPTKKFWLTSPKAYKQKGYEIWQQKARNYRDNKA